MYNEPTKIHPPLYLASTTIECWRCGTNMPAIALIAPNVPGELILEHAYKIDEKRRKS